MFPTSYFAPFYFAAYYFPEAGGDGDETLGAGVDSCVIVEVSPAQLRIVAR